MDTSKKNCNICCWAKILSSWNLPSKLNALLLGNNIVTCICTRKNTQSETNIIIPNHFNFVSSVVYRMLIFILALLSYHTLREFYDAKMSNLTILWATVSQNWRIKFKQIKRKELFIKLVALIATVRLLRRNWQSSIRTRVK